MGDYGKKNIVSLPCIIMDIYRTAVKEAQPNRLYTRLPSVGQRHVILSPIDAHYKWPQNKIYSLVS